MGIDTLAFVEIVLGIVPNGDTFALMDGEGCFLPYHLTEVSSRTGINEDVNNYSTIN